MNWEELHSLPKTKDTLARWQKQGTFRNNHLTIGAGKHERLSKTPYVFSRTYIKDDVKGKVVVGIDLPKGRSRSR